MEALPCVAASLPALAIAAMVVLHVTLQRHDVQRFLRLRGAWRVGLERSQRQVDQRLRYEKELHETRIRNFGQMNKAFIHLTFLLAGVCVWRLMHIPSPKMFTHAAVLGVGYSLHSLADGRVTSNTQVQILQMIFCILHLTFVVSLFWEEELVILVCCDKILCATLGFLSLFFIDFKVTLPLQALESILLCWQQWQLIGAEDLNLINVSCSVAAHVLCFATIALVELAVRSNIAAKVDSHDASSLMLGFRQVLRGVSDGDLLLDKGSCTIVDDAGCLERLLKSKKKLSETSFLDLFLDSSSRENFLHFLNAADTAAETAMPRGLRVSLQGAEGPVSMDLFHTQVLSGGGKDYCLLALKEDAEERAPPDARPGAIPAAIPLASGLGSQTRSEDTEILDAYEELLGIGLVFSNETGLLDIKQVQLSFQRQSWAPTIESGMPTLRRFIRPSDWDRIEKMLHNVMSLPPAEIERRCYFRHPMLFRVPGTSRSYFCSKETYICMADHFVGSSGSPQRPIHFRMHLSSFDGRAILRPREQELEGIDEEAADNESSESNEAVSSSMEAVNSG